MSRVNKHLQALGLTDLLNRTLPFDTFAEIVQPGVGPVWSGRRVNGRWLKDPRVGWELPVALLAPDASRGYTVVQGAGGFTVLADGRWQLTADDANPIVRVRFPLVGTTDGVQRCAITLSSFVITNPVWSIGRADLDSALELRAIGQSGGSDNCTACVMGHVAGNTRVYNAKKFAATAFAFRFMATGTHLWLQHQVLDDAPRALALSRIRKGHSADLANASAEGLLDNPGIIPGEDGHRWELEVHQGGAGASVNVVVSHLEFGGRDGTPKETSLQ